MGCSRTKPSKAPSRSRLFVSLPQPPAAERRPPSKPPQTSQRTEFPFKSLFSVPTGVTVVVNAAGAVLRRPCQQSARGPWGHSREAAGGPLGGPEALRAGSVMVDVGWLGCQ